MNKYTLNSIHLILFNAEYFAGTQLIPVNVRTLAWTGKAALNNCELKMCES